MRRAAVGVLVVLSAALAAAYAGSESLAEEPEPRVSMLRLIARSDEYHGRLVEVAGFCRFEFEGNALYLHEEDFDNFLTENGLWLSVGWPVPEKWREFSDEYVTVVGVFNAKSRGHNGSFSGAIQHVRAIFRQMHRREVERTLRLLAPLPK